MKVQELIDALQSYPKDATILIDCEEYQTTMLTLKRIGSILNRIIL